MGFHRMKTASSDVDSVLLHPLASIVGASKFGFETECSVPKRKK